MNVTIRTIQNTDDGALAAIVRDNLRSHGLALPGTAYFDPELDHLSRFYEASEKRQYFVAAAAGGTVLGGAGIAEFAGDRTVAELQKLYLSEAAKGHGLGYRLLAEAEAFAVSAGYHFLYLETHHVLEAANHIYEKSGFRRMDGPLAGSLHGAMDVFWGKEIG